MPLNNNLPDKRTLGIGLTILALVVSVVAGIQQDMSFVEFLTFLTTVEALGAISSVVLTLLRKMYPAIDEEIATLASVVLAAVISAFARTLLGHVADFPPWIDEYWPLLVYIAQQVWWLLTSNMKFNKDVATQSARYYGTI